MEVNDVNFPPLVADKQAVATAAMVSQKIKSDYNILSGVTPSQKAESSNVTAFSTNCHSVSKSS